MKIKEALVQAQRQLRDAGVDTPSLDAEVLLANVLGIERSLLWAHPGRVLLPEEMIRFFGLVEQRSEHVPVAYLTGRKEFMGLELSVSPDVLVPRPETELLVEVALDLLESHPHPLVVDVGTGSGAIAVSLARYHPASRVIATDISPAALAVAAVNAHHHGLRDRIELLQGNLLEPLPPGLAGRVDLIAANLPYISSAEMKALPRDVRAEPFSALDGGPDGLSLYRELVPEATFFLASGGYILIEIGPGQGERAMDLFAGRGWTVEKRLDMAGRERLVVARRAQGAGCRVPGVRCKVIG